MADVNFTTTDFTISTGTGTQDVTVSGMSASGDIKAVIFICSGGTVDGTAAADARMSVGFSDGTTDYVGSTWVDDGQTTTNATRHLRSDGVIAMYTDITLDHIFSVNSFITDGVRLDIDNQAATAFYCTVVFIHGTDVTNASVGEVNLGTGTAAIDITAPAFEPDIVFLLNSGTSSAPPNAEGNSSFGFGCAINDGSASQACAAFGSQDNQSDSSNSITMIRNDRISTLVFNNNPQYDVLLSDFDANGFSLTPSLSAGSDRIFYLALAFSNSPDIDLVNMSYPTSGDYAETTPGFQPDFGMIVQTGDGNTINTKNGVGGSFSIAVFDDTNIFTDTITDEDGITLPGGTTNAQSLHSSSLKILSEDGATTLVEASGYAFDSSGVDFTLTTNPFPAELGWALYVGQAAGGGGGPIEIEVLPGGTPY